LSCAVFWEGFTASRVNLRNSPLERRNEHLKFISDTGVNPVDEFQLEYADYGNLIESEPEVEPYLPIVRNSVHRYRHIYPVDPLLVLALIKHESNFQERALSPMGAAGLMQFIPSTARSIGLSPVISGNDYERGKSARRSSYDLLSRAIRQMKEGQFSLMKDSTERWRNISRKANRLLNAYEETIRRTISEKSNEQLKRIDQRFVPSLAIPAGVKYLSKMLDRRNGDFREALSAYNAGPANVGKYGGIPPFEQTVRYQNRIINTYREYRESVSGSVHS